MKKKIAFTIAEILIVIAILGFVAAVTIPVMVKDYLRTLYSTGAKETYAQFNNVLKKINADYQCDNDLRCTNIFANGTTTQTLGKEFVKYFKVAIDCETSIDQKCWPDNTNDNFDGSSSTNNNFNTSNYYYKFTGANGMSYAIHNYKDDYSADCANNASTGVFGNNSFMSQVCGVLIVDVNGYRKPNTKGKDTFIFYITNGRGPLAYPSGGMDDNMAGTNNYWNQESRNYCNTSTNTDGKYCTARLLDKGWDMDYFN